MRLTSPDQLRSLIVRQLQSYGTYEHYPVGFLKTALRGYMEVEVDVDQWPDPSSFVLKIKKDQNVPKYMKKKVHMYTKDPSQLANLIRQPGVLDWTQSWDLDACAESISSILPMVVKEKDGWLELYEECNFVYEIHPQSSSIREFPTGYTHASLTPNQAKMVNDLWKHNEADETEKYIRYCIESFPSNCIYNTHGIPVAWHIVSQDMCGRMAYVVPEERGNNLAGHLAGLLANKINQMGDVPFVYIGESNPASIKHARKAGLSKLPGKLIWGKYHPPHLVVASKL